LAAGCDGGAKGGVGAPDSTEDGIEKGNYGMQGSAKGLVVTASPHHSARVSKSPSNSHSEHKYYPGTEVTVTAARRGGFRFMGWTAMGEGVVFADANSTTTTFTMPDESVTVTAIFEEYKDEGEPIYDSRDGKTYKTVKIGDQTWMAENLNFQTEGSRCYGEGGKVLAEVDGLYGKTYAPVDLAEEDVQSNCDTYGRLYTWDDAMAACPVGWHLPDRQEWDDLIITAGGSFMTVESGVQSHSSNTGGVKLRARPPYWKRAERIGPDGTDDFGFSALPGGSGTVTGDFGSMGLVGRWWTGALEYHVNSQRYRYMTANGDVVISDITPKTAGLSVRCVQD
jgi:uncharacterized protein (TIGR02145 family)